MLNTTSEENTGTEIIKFEVYQECFCGCGGNAEVTYVKTLCDSDWVPVYQYHYGGERMLIKKISDKYQVISKGRGHINFKYDKSNGDLWAFEEKSLEDENVVYKNGEVYANLGVSSLTYYLGDAFLNCSRNGEFAYVYDNGFYIWNNDLSECIRYGRGSGKEPKVKQYDECFINDKLMVIMDVGTVFIDYEDYFKSNIKINEEIKTITGLHLKDIKIENAKQQIVDKLNVLEDQILKITNYDGKEIETGKNVGTGTKVTVKNGNSEKEYTIVIYGDITGDGEINAVDALALIKGINNKVSFKSDAHKEAGRILVGDGEEPTALDALAIVKAANNKYTINQSK